jgi:hypothetical protein
MPFSLYVKLFLSPLDGGLARIGLAPCDLLGKDLVLLTAGPIEKDRASPAAFLEPIADERVVLRAPRYKDPSFRELLA